MIAIRNVGRRWRWWNTEDFRRQLAVNFGYQRLGAKIGKVIDKHIRSAKRRSILQADDGMLALATTHINDYTRDELVEAITKVTRKRSEYTRDEVTRAVANYFGFARVTTSVHQALKSAINGAIRRGILAYEGDTVWRIK